MDILAEARRRAFSVWLRTGRLPRWARPADPEVKFNPWHDPDDGRFTFRGTGKYFGPAGGGQSDARMHERPPVRGRRREPHGGFGGGGQGFTGGGAGGSWDAPEAKPKRADARNPARSRDRATALQQPTRSAGMPASNRSNWRSVQVNGYEWRFDASDRFREVEGILHFSESPRRSRTAQTRAGGTDRRTSDDGGHYVAPRFDGPTAAFNHFAQDANFNRGRYRALEDQWARALRAGKRVRVKIAPVYAGLSRRPSMINVWFWIDGRRQSLQFPNESLENPSAR